MDAIAVLPDGRIATIGPGGRLVWDPDAPSASPIELGHRAGIASAVAVLSDGRVVTFESDFSITSTHRQMMVCDPDAPATSRVKLGHHADGHTPAGRARQPDRHRRGRWPGILWDPDHPGLAPVELGRHEAAWNTVNALAVLEDGRIVTAGDGITRPDSRVLLWDPDLPGLAPIELVRHKAAWDAARALGVLGDARIVHGR